MHSTSIRIMSFNLRTWTTQDRQNAFPYRTERIRQVILRESPDIIGFQEFTAEMKAMIRSLLPEYTIVGCGRNTDYSGESMAIALKNGSVELLSLNQFWLSPTPTIPGSCFTEDQSNCPRMALFARLVAKGLSAPFLVCNTHLDHIGAQARYQGMMQIVQHMSSYDGFLVLTGDMNATPDAPEIKLAVDALKMRGMADHTSNLGGTFHNFGRLLPDQTCKIDYIFSNTACDRAWCVAEPDDSGFYSDHYAICADLLFPAE